jgi:alpha-galactosidase
VHGGYNPFDDAFSLAPGQTHTTPAFVGGFSPEGWGGASRRLHAFTRERVLPVVQDSPPVRPVLYNSWYATEFDITARQQIALAEKAAMIGVELFCVDDAWFGGRRSSRAGLGDWWVSPEVFPEGLTPLVRRVRELGMSFGLWFEPEMVNPDSELYRKHPDWVLHFPGRPRREMRNQLVLDFGRPEVIEHVYAAIDHVVSQYKIDFIKWDMNRYPSEPGSVVGPAIWREHVRGLYGFMDRLRADHPGLAIETCAGGGGRIDLGVLARTDQAWVSDTVDPYDRLHIQEGYSLAYPPRTLVAWVTDRPADDADLQRRFDVAMRGVLGIGSDLMSLTETQLDQYRQQIGFYKTIRRVVQHGDLHRLERLERSGEGEVSVWFSVLPDKSEAVYSVALHDAQIGRIRSSRPLVGLDAAATYVVRDATGQTVEQQTGYDLMCRGLPIEPMEMRGHTRTLHLVRQPPDSP